MTEDEILKEYEKLQEEKRAAKDAIKKHTIAGILWFILSTITLGLIIVGTPEMLLDRHPFIYPAILSAIGSIVYSFVYERGDYLWIGIWIGVASIVLL